MNERTVEAQSVAELIGILQDLPPEWAVGSGVDSTTEIPFIYVEDAKPGKSGITVIIQEMRVST